MTEVLAIIPARGGSKGIPGKNIRPLAGRPLISYTIEDALRTPEINRVVVSTDDEEIGHVSRQWGTEVVQRPPAISGDEASSESALRHTLDYFRESEGYEPDVVVFLQATSPIRQADDIQKALQMFAGEEADSLFSACPLHGFVWRREGETVTSFSYDYRQRQRRQDAPEDFVENGSIYIFKPWVLNEFDNRLGGRIVLYPMATADSFQIDEPGDLDLMSHLLPVRRAPTIPDLSGVKLLVLDFDGVLTDNRVLVTEDGKEAVTVHRGDGWGIARLKEAGVAVLVLSTEKNPVVAARCRKLDVPYIQGSDDKLAALQAVVEERELNASDVAFVGNDVNDLACLKWVGTSIGVQDTVTAVKNAVRWVTSKPGGYGAVREVCDLILRQRNQIDDSWE